jgi:peptidoglycan/xylan/chitin deacetylase (PgdA/CDA1 family)
MPSRERIVLCYHAVSPSWQCSLAVTPERLEQQLSLLVGRGWVGATLSQAVLDPPAPRTLAVTFDDAFASVIELALPILSELGIVATVFTPTSFMSRRQPLSWPGVDQWLETSDRHEMTSMSWDDLGTLVEHGWEIGSHSRTHPHLTQIDDERLGAELAGSRAECTERLGCECVSVAYPYGDVDSRVARQARTAGYRAGAGLGKSLRRVDDFRTPRIGIYNNDAAWRFRLKVSTPGRWLRR